MAEDLLVRIDATTAGYEAGLARARAATLQFETALRKTQLDMARLEKQMNDELVAKSAARSNAIREVGTAFGAVGLAAAVGVGAVIHSTMDFDSAMSAVEAATRAGSEEMGRFRKAALDLGQSTRYSATETAGAITELAKAGVSNADILGGALKGSLDLAASQMMDVGEAAKDISISLNQFDLSGSSASHVADVLAASAGRATGEVEDIATAMSYVGPIAHQMGISIEETAGTVALLAQQGILGSKAGTGLRGVLATLSAPSKVAAAEMKDLGLNVFNAQGNFVGFNGVAEQLQHSLKGATQAQVQHSLGIIFTNQQLQTANILYEGGAEAVDRWTKKVDVSGFAAEQAATKMDNLAGDVEQLRGALETAFISTGEDSQGGLRQMVQTITDLVQAYNSLPGPVKAGVFALGGITAAAGLGVFAVSRLVTSYADLRKNMATLRGTADLQGAAMTGLNKKTIAIRGGAAVAAAGLYGLNAALGDSHKELRAVTSIAATAAAGFAVGGPWGAAVGGAVGALQLFGQSNADAAQQTEALSETLDQQSAALTENTRELVINNLQKAGAYDAARQVGVGLGTVTAAALGNTAALKRVTAATLAYQATLPASSRQAGQLSAGELLNNILGEQSGHLRDAIRETKNKATADRELKRSTDGVGGAMGRSAEKTKAMEAALKAAREAGKSTGDSFLAFGDDLDDASVSLDQFLHHMQQQAQALRQFRENAELAASKGLDKGLIFKLNEAGPTGALRLKQIAHAGDDMIHHLNSAFESGARESARLQDAIGAIATAVNKVPATKTIRLYLQGADTAFLTIGRISEALNRIRYNTIQLTTVRATGGRALPNAEGGTIGGQRHPYGDKVLSMLAPGEEVISNRHGQADRFRADRASGRIPRYAEGGTVGRYADGGTVTAAEQAHKEQAIRDRRERMDAARERRDHAALEHLEHALDRLRETLAHQHPLTPRGLMRRLDRPEDTPDFGDIRRDFGAMKQEVHDVARAERDLYAVRMASRNGTRQVADTEKQLERARGAEKKDKGEIAALEKRLTAQRQNAKVTDKDLADAEKDLSKQRDQLSAATDKWKQAQQELIQQAQAIRDTVLGTGSIFGGEGEASTAQGLRAKLADAANQAETFDRMLHRLRKRHLDKDIIQQLVDEGPTPQAVALAQSLAQAPASLIQRINNQQHALEAAANQIGLFGVGGRHQHHRRHHIGSGGSGAGEGDVNYNLNMNGPITVPSVKRLAGEIFRKQQQAVRIAGGA